MEVTIAPPGPEDADEFIVAARASRDLHQPWLFPADVGELYAAYLDRVSRGDTVGYLIRHRECGRLAGYVNINDIVRGALQSGFLGYGAFAGHEGRGLMTEGLRLVLDEAFGPLGLHRVEANIQPANTRSIALVKRLGFTREGFSPRYLLVNGDWRDHERWALLSDQRRLRPAARGGIATTDPGIYREGTRCSAAGKLSGQLERER